MWTYVYVCKRRCSHAMMHVQREEDNIPLSVLSFQHGATDRTKVIKFDSRQFYLRTHFASPPIKCFQNIKMLNSQII